MYQRSLSLVQSYSEKKNRNRLQLMILQNRTLHLTCMRVHLLKRTLRGIFQSMN